jgi:hypothetical protein
MLEYAPRSEKFMTYNEALLYCQFCNHNDYKDWRIMTRNEWLPGLGWYYDHGIKLISRNYVTPVRDI